MPHFYSHRVLALVAAEILIATSGVHAQGLKDPGSLTGVQIETGRAEQNTFSLVGTDARQQLVVTGRYQSGQLRDLTRSVTYDVQPPGIVQVDATGVALPIADGSAVITARIANDIHASVQVQVTRMSEVLPLNFERHIQPILTKFSCNSGGCHGKAGGQNGFSLSLLGFESSDDYQRLVHEGRGRRIFPAIPERSLLLQKPSGGMPHGGGTRLSRQSASYRVLHRWIEHGLPYGTPSDPQVVSIDVLPRERMLPLASDQQIVVVARYSDGTTEDVTSLAQYESNAKPLAQVNGAGLVTVLDHTGSAAIMARYQGHVATFRVGIPLAAPVDNLPSPRNFVDEHVFRQLKAIGLPPSEICSDDVFLRRVTIDIAGRIPTPAETEQFLASTDPAKRDQWIDHLLESGDYADYFARKWLLLLRSRRQATVDARGTIGLKEWLREAFYTNLPYDKLAGELLTASGDLEESPAVNWWRQIKNPSDQVENTAQIFLGLRLACARCHHHPFEQWSQQDYYGLSAFFSRVGRKYGKEYQANVERIFHDRGVASIPHPRTGQPVYPAGLGGKPVALAPDDDPRQALVTWMTASSNPYFAPALVNRYWKHFLGRGLVDPEDDMRATNPPSNPELLDLLAHHFREQNYDLKDLVRTLCRSHTYQLSSEANSYNLEDTQNHARFYPRRMSAEVLLDSIDDVTIARANLGGAPNLPIETRAIQLPHDPYPYHYFLQIFGMPEGTTACECERIDTANLAQNLHLMNSSEILSKVSSPTGRAALMAADATRTSEQKVREIFLLVYSRPPRPKEFNLALKHLEKAKSIPDQKGALEDLIWALLNTKEFMYIH
jgi:hypothetical protein